LHFLQKLLLDVLRIGSDQFQNWPDFQGMGRIMQQKPTLGFWQIWNMCFGFMGIQFGFALQNANVSRIFQTLGADLEDIPILWVAAPLTGLLVQPIVGYLSDQTWNQFGRRRPYFLIGAILASIALFWMPNSPVLWVAAGMLWIMDASINITMEPFRAFVGDMLPEEQHTRGFAMQSFFIGIGSVVASSLPWILTNWLNISNTAPEGVIPDSVKYSFYAGGAALLLTVLWTIYRTKEYSPDELDAFAQAKDTASPETKTTGNHGQNRRSAGQYRNQGSLWLLAGLAATWLVDANGLDKQLFIVTLGSAAFGLMQFIASMQINMNAVDNGFYKIVDDIFHMPKAMKQLSVVQFFSWFALFAMWIYSTSGVTSFHYGTDDVLSAAYNEGADWVGILFAAYNGFAALSALAIPFVAKKLGRRQTHLINMCLGGIGLISFAFISDPKLLIISMVGVGIAWASILSLPYSLLSSAVPHAKMGTYMGIFNFFIVIPQLLAASVLGLLLRVIFDGEAIYALVLGGILMICGGFATLLVDEDTSKP